MPLRMFSVKDLKADAFMHPFFSHNSATAEREFRRMCADPNSHLFHTAEDFELYEVCIWNDEVGVVVARDVPALIITAVKVKETAS